MVQRYLGQIGDLVAYGEKRTWRDLCKSVANDPERRFDTLNYRTAKGSFDHLVDGGEKGMRNGETETLAVFRLITSSNLVGCSTGKSAGFSPFRMRPA